MEKNLEETSVWNFEKRGSWSTHVGSYRGNWPPQVPRNILLRFSKENDLVLDMFNGGGTTLVECKLLNRNAIGIDINPNPLNITKEALKFDVQNKSIQKLILGDAKNMHFIKNESIDLICTHPPYANIIKYSDGIDGDLSLLNESDFLKDFSLVAREANRVLRSGNKMVYMIGDIRKNGNVFPLGFTTLDICLKNGFKLNEIIIKIQHNCQMSSKWINILSAKNKYLLAHEYIFILTKI